MDGKTREARDEDVIHGIVVEHLVRGEDQTVVNRGHNLLDMAVVERQHTVENDDFVVTQGLLALAMELEEALELGLLVPRRVSVLACYPPTYVWPASWPRAQSSNLAIGQAIGANKIMRAWTIGAQ